MPATTLVRDVMTTTSRRCVPISRSPTRPTSSPTHKFGAMPVVDAEGHLVGIFQDTDLIVSEARVHVPTYLSILGVVGPAAGRRCRISKRSSTRSRARRSAR